MKSRAGARLFGALVLLVANGFLAVMIYVYYGAPTSAARIDHCSHTSKFTTCYGSWPTSGGGSDSGEVHGTDSGDIGHTVPVRLALFGAWSEDGSSKWIELGFPVLIDAIALGAHLLVARPLNRRALAAAQALLARPGTHLRAGGGVLRDADDEIVLASTVGDTVRAADDRPWFRIDRSAATSVALASPDGTPLGLVRRSNTGVASAYALTAPDGAVLGVATPAADRLTYDLVVHGTTVGVIGLESRRSVVLAGSLPAGDLRALVVALLLELPRLAGVRTAAR